MFFIHQLETRKNKDWSSQVLKDVTDFEINHSMEEIKTIDEEAWKKLIKCKTTEKSLKYLNLNIGSKSRKYVSLEMSNYLTSKN